MSTPTKQTKFTVTDLAYSLKAFWLYGPGVFTVILSYYMLTNLSQGQDVLMIMGESKGSAFFAIVAVCFWALVMWYSARLIGYEKLYEDNRWSKIVISIFPRMLAYNAFVSVEAAILGLPTVCNLTLWWLLGFIILQNVYSFLLYTIYRYPDKRSKLRIGSAVGLGLVYVVSILITIRKAESDHARLLPIVVVFLFLLRIIFLWWFVYRRVLIDKREEGKEYPEEPEYLRLFGLRLIRIPAWFLNHEVKTFRIFNAVAFFGLLLFIMQVAYIPFANGCGPLVVVLLSFCLLTGGLHIITAISVRLRFNLFILLFVWAWIKGNFHELYPVQLTTRQPAYNFSQRPTLATYFKSWIAHRKEKITDNYPVFVVLADGGASRSGYWVASVLNEWQNLYPQGQALNDHLLCLSGASGGSVGNAAYYAQLQTNTNGAVQFLTNDFLSSCLTRLLGTDPARHIIPLPVTDRADAIAITMQDLSHKSLKGAFAKNWEEVIDTTGRLPVLLINTTRVQGGKPAVISTVSLSDFSERFDVLQSLDSTAHSFTLATASILGARFPYVSPAGAIGKNQFVDGGYFDNSGAGVVHEMLFYLDSLGKADATLARIYSKLRFHVVHITNNPLPGKDPEAISPLANDLAAPLLTVFNTYASQTEVNDARLTNFLREKEGHYTIINLYDSASKDYPMNWVISSYRLNLMQAEVQRVKEKELKALLKP